MACSFFSDSDGVNLFYAVDPDHKLDMPADTVWKPIPYTSESLDVTLNKAQSERVGIRHHVDQATVSGSVSGSFTFEAHSSSLMDNMLISVLQSDQLLNLDEANPNWTEESVIYNGRTKRCFAFLKRVKIGSKYDFYLFRGMQIGSMTISVDTSSLVTVDISVIGMGIGNPESGKDVYYDIENGQAPLDEGGWTFEDFVPYNAMRSGDEVSDITIADHNNLTIDHIPHSLTITIDNQLREQYAVGKNNRFAEGVASGRILTTIELSSYYLDSTIVQAMMLDKGMATRVYLKNGDDVKYAFYADFIKPQQSNLPKVGSADSDLFVELSFQCFQNAETGTIHIGKREPGYILLEDGNHFLLESNGKLYLEA